MSPKGWLCVRGCAVRCVSVCHHPYRSQTKRDTKLRHTPMAFFYMVAVVVKHVVNGGFLMVL